MVSVGAVSAANTGSAAEAASTSASSAAVGRCSSRVLPAADSFVRMGVVFILHLL